ncbi:MAG: RNA polymerase subunit sigma-70 [Bacteroidetes bacterium]|nr:MAG: RNA polymerase subunit sigma-70 [Bacteroidota bacterium]
MKQSELQEVQFTKILESHKKLVFKIANAYSRNKEDRQDLVQEVVLHLWKAFPKYDKKYSFSTWIYRIALNVSISYYRKEKTRKKTYSGYQTQVEIINSEDLVFDKRLKQLYKFIDQLKSLDKAIIILYLEGLKNKEIADIMGMSITNVSTKMNRIKNKLSSNFESKK